VRDANDSQPPASEASPEPPEVEVVIEVPRGSFLKRRSTGHIDFISPLPCPFNYGSVPIYLGLG
jgi:inorganic pyrophosphatase